MRYKIKVFNLKSIIDKNNCLFLILLHNMLIIKFETNNKFKDFLFFFFYFQNMMQLSELCKDIQCQLIQFIN